MRHDTEATVRNGALLLGITVLALILRLFRLDHQDVWLDEAATFQNVIAFQTAGLVGLARLDQVAPLHTVLTALVVDQDHHSVFMMRLPSAIFGALAVPALYMASREMAVDRRTSLIAAALLALSPFGVWYAQEARMYSGLLLMSVLYVWVCWPATHRAFGTRNWVLAGLITAAGLMMHHYTVFLITAFGSFLLVRDGTGGIGRNLIARRSLVWVSSQIIPVLLLLAWLYVTSEQLGRFTYFAKESPALWLPYALYSFVAGVTFGPSLGELRVAPLAALRDNAASIALAATATVPLLLAGLLSRRVAPAVRLWLVLWLTLPLALAVVAALAAGITFNVRYVIVAYPALLVLIATGIDRALPEKADGAQDAVALAEPRRRGGVSLGICAVLLLGIFLTSLGNHYFNKRYGRERVAPLAAALRTMPPGTLLVIDNSRLQIPLHFYGMPVPAAAILVDNKLWARTPEVAIGALRNALSRHGANVWLVQYRSWESDPMHEVADWIGKHGRVTGRTEWTGTTLTRFAAVKS